MGKSVKDLLRFIGKKGDLLCEGSLRFPIVVTDAKEHFGRIDLLVSTQGEGSGVGEGWVSSKRVQFKEQV